MTVDKMSVSLAPSLSSAVRHAAERAGETLSGWLAHAAQSKLRSRALDEFLAVWEKRNGALTEQEMGEAAARLGPVESTVAGWTTIFKLIAADESREELARTIARILDAGHSVYVLEEDVGEVPRMMPSGSRVSLVKTDVLVRQRTP